MDETCPLCTGGGGGGCSRRAAPSGRATLQRDGVGALTEHALPTPTDVTKPKPQRFTLRISARRAHRWSHLRPQRALGPGGGTRLDPAAVHAGVFPAVPHHATARARRCPHPEGAAAGGWLAEHAGEKLIDPCRLYSSRERRPASLLLKRGAPGVSTSQERGARRLVSLREGRTGAFRATRSRSRPRGRAARALAP